jgi:hypothetical protein
MTGSVTISSINYSAYAAQLASRRAVAVTAKATGSARATSAAAPSGEPGGVTVSLSAAARERYATLLGGQSASAASSSTPSGSSESTEAGAASTAVRTSGELSEPERQAVQELRSIDSNVRVHEQAHQSAGGRYAGAPCYSYTNGPDNKQYATAGEVSIDMSPVPNQPRQTVEKMKIVQRAAMAPADPSGQDRAVYARAVQLEQQARTQLGTAAAK